MRISVLGSGSGGNSTLIQSRTASVLVDLGFGPRSLSRRIKQAGMSDVRIDGILLTHGHYDHCSGVTAFLKRNKVPVFMNEGTRQEHPDLEAVDSWEPFTGDCFSIGDLKIQPFAVSHDSAEPVGFRLEAEGLCGAIVTDIGEVTPSVCAHLEHCDWLILESNHDEKMLQLGRYPWSLKQRVMGRKGHLSNSAAANFLSNQFDGHARHVFLAHLSRENNDPEIALGLAKRALRQRRFAMLEGCEVHLTDQLQPSIVLNL